MAYHIDNRLSSARQHLALNLLVHEPLSALPRQPKHERTMDTLPCRTAIPRSQEIDMNYNYTAI